MKKTVRPYRGTAVVELATCLPIFFLLLFGSIEACNMVFLKQVLTASAYEAAREAIEPEATTIGAKQRAHDVLTSRSISAYAVTLSPSNIEDLNPGETIRVSVSASADANSTVPTPFRHATDIRAEIVMSKQ